MEFYLQECKHNLKNANESIRVNVVLGNEACDLDSAVSAIVFAYFLSKIQNSSDVIVPVLNVKRKDVHLRTEVVFFLEETSIPISDLIFIDEIDLKVLSKNEKLNLVLVDHNSLSVEQSYLEPCIIQIVDHHAVEVPEKLNRFKTKIEPVGSCCTLVAEEILNSKKSIIDPQIAMLLFGTILLDTVCLKESAKRATEKDRMVVLQLEEYLEGISREEIFETLQKVKFDVSNLTPEQLLRRDTKYVQQNSLSVAIASLPMLLQDILKQESFLSALNKMVSEENLMCIIMHGSEIVKDKATIKRQIAIYNNNAESLEKMSNYLLSLNNPSLSLHPLPLFEKPVNLFEQENIALTRKFVLPAIQTYLKSVHSGPPEKNESLVLQENCVKGLDEIEKTIPTYLAETLDFPDSPSHHQLSGITVQLQKLNSDGNEENDLLDADDFECRKDICVEGGGTLKRISVSPMILKSEDVDIEDDQRSLSSLSNKSDLDVFSPTDDIIMPDDVDTLEELENSDYFHSSVSDPIPEMSAAEEFEEERSWKSCIVNGEERKIDMKVIEPYRKVLSHGGYVGTAHNAIIVFSACYLPDHCRKDYDYVMDNLFLYVINTLDELVAEDYVLVYFHGATDRSNMPSFSWLKRCYQMIDRRLRKNLKGLYLVHPTFWLKTIVIMTRPFISSKFSRKLKFVYSLKELSLLIPLDQVSIPDKVKQFDVDLFPDS
ncbi:exopolyphosphatase PRUNE1-like isoform X2 [Stegodyphus dumicola]|nr:exopolyphosphatase PRUNE1-like isoform X2 [Stegodyphus dumicola]